MAGKGPAPAHSRRRSNEPSRGEWVDLDPIEKPVLPTLGTLRKLKWSPATIAMWEAWRRDPVTRLWSPADLVYALDTIRLHEQMVPSTASEVRLRMDGLGLTPKGKRDLRWRIVEADEPVLSRPRRDGMGSARRARLSVIK